MFSQTDPVTALINVFSYKSKHPSICCHLSRSGFWGKGESRDFQTSLSLTTSSGFSQGDRSIPKPAERYVSSVSWICPGTYSQWDIPKTTPLGGTHCRWFSFPFPHLAASHRRPSQSSPPDDAPRTSSCAKSRAMIPRPLEQKMFIRKFLLEVGNEGWGLCQLLPVHPVQHPPPPAHQLFALVQTRASD